MSLPGLLRTAARERPDAVFLAEASMRARTCLQYHGGLGHMEETWTARFLRDMRITSIGGGADEVMLEVIATMHGI